jgi:hypothetical protein
LGVEPFGHDRVELSPLIETVELPEAEPDEHARDKHNDQSRYQPLGSSQRTEHLGS